MTRSFLHMLGAVAGIASRREALSAGVAAVGGLLLRDVMAAAPPARLGHRVVVLGAGLAGLACADELAYAGYDVTVFEARERLGGRVVSLTDLVRGKTVEGGGELVGPNQPVWGAYKARFGLEFIDMPAAPTDVIELNGRLLGRPQALALYSEMRAGLRGLNTLAAAVPAYTPWEARGAAALDKQSLAGWIDRQKVSLDCKTAMAVQLTAINGIVPGWQSLLGVLAIVKGGGLDRFWDETDTQHVKGGAQRLAVMLADSLRRRSGRAVRLGRPASAVRLRRGGVAVELRGGGVVEADDAVVTLPPSVWNRVTFEPALPPGLATPMADNVKYLGVTGGRPWAAAGRSVNALSDGPVQLTWETTAGQGDGGEHAVVAISGGPSGDTCRSWGEAERDAKYRDTLDRFWPGFKAASVRGRLFDWLGDPYSRGSYSFPAPGQVTVAGPLLARGVGGRIHFAGEHCCYAFTGWMEGALSSGVRLARRLVERDGVVKPAAR